MEWNIAAGSSWWWWWWWWGWGGGETKSTTSTDGAGGGDADAEDGEARLTKFDGAGAAMVDDGVGVDCEHVLWLWYDWRWDSIWFYYTK